MGQKIKGRVLVPDVTFGGWQWLRDGIKVDRASGVQILEGEEYSLSIEDGGGFVDRYIPDGEAPMWDMDRIVSKQVGDVYQLRIIFKCETGQNPIKDDSVLMQLRVGSSNFYEERRMLRARDQEETMAFSFPFFVGAQFVVDNPAQVFVSATKDITLWDPQIFIQRTYRNLHR